MIETAKRMAAMGALCAAASLAAQSAPAPAPATTDPEPGIVVNGKQVPAPSGNEVFNEARGISRSAPTRPMSSPCRASDNQCARAFSA